MERLCVFCGSRVGRGPAYADAARTVGETLARRDIGLVYGGGQIGLMGVLADATLDAGGDVYGFIPETLIEREQPHHGLTELTVVDSFHERKRRMAATADGFLALPGGFGTLDELLEVVTWTQHGIHEKPCGFLEVEGFFEDLAAFFRTQVSEGFVDERHRNIVAVSEDVTELLNEFEAFETGSN